MFERCQTSCLSCLKCLQKKVVIIYKTRRPNLSFLVQSTDEVWFTERALRMLSGPLEKRIKRKIDLQALKRQSFIDLIGEIQRTQDSKVSIRNYIRLSYHSHKPGHLRSSKKYITQHEPDTSRLQRGTSYSWVMLHYCRTTNLASVWAEYCQRSRCGTLSALES